MLFDLIKKWHRLEPNHIRMELVQGFECFWVPTCSYHSYRVAVVEDPGEGDFAEVQRGVQYAIAARHLGLKLHYDPTREMWGAHLFCVDADEGDTWRWSEITKASWHPEPAIALLDAYIQALEACQ